MLGKKVRIKKKYVNLKNKTVMMWFMTWFVADSGKMRSTIILTKLRHETN
jgi:hypothetical protein